MYNTAYFSRMPRTMLPATRVSKPQPIIGTSNHGRIVPLFCNLVMPGQVDSCDLDGVIWMSTPIAPILSQIKGSINTFFVPMRLVWEHTKEFFGENTTSAGPQTVQYKIPSTYFMNDIGDGASLIEPGSSGAVNDVIVGSAAHYLGKPLLKRSDDGSNNIRVDILKERAYWLVWSEFYRHQQVQNPFIINMGDTDAIGSIDGEQVGLNTACAKCLKDFDAYTTSTISPNYGGEVLLPLGSIAPVYLEFDSTASGSFASGNDYALKYGVVDSGDSGSVAGKKFNLSEKNANGYYRLEAGSANDARIYADLSQATAAKIDDLYTAMAAQAWYHNANFGSRYFEMNEIHYGVSNPDLVLFRPEHVSEFKFDIVVTDVISAAGASGDSSTKLGQPGAMSRTVIKKHLYNHSFGEWGYLICLFNTYHQRYYSAGVAREDLYQDLFDFYFPEFANRGDDKVFDAELFYDGSIDQTDDVFGYQEAYYDRRYYNARVTGLLDPYAEAGVNSSQNAIGRWALAEKWSNVPTLSAEFLQEDRGAISQALVTGENGPDYVWSFLFRHKELLPMPAYSKPGVPSFGRGIL